MPQENTERAMTGAPMIVPNRDGKAPSLKEITALQAAARVKGLFAEWPYVLVLENGDLLLCCEPQTGERGADLIASKGQFYLDSDMLCKNPL